MSQAATETTSTTETAGQTSADTSTETTSAEAGSATDATETADGALGDAGKKALDAMKAERKAAKEAAAAEKARADALQAKLDGKEAEHAAAQAKAEADKAVLDKANGRILSWAVQAAAKGVLADPADAHKFLDLDSFEVGDDGEVDEEAITAALKTLVEKKPYLGAQGGRFQGSADGGARNGAGTSIDDQIADATKAGNHQLAIALKQRRAAEIAAKKS